MEHKYRIQYVLHSVICVAVSEPFYAQIPWYTHKQHKLHAFLVYFALAKKKEPEKYTALISYIFAALD